MCQMSCRTFQSNALLSAGVCQEAKAKKIVSHKKIKDDEKEKEKKDKPEKGHCFWESVTMTMRQISPTKKLEKMEGWEPPHLEDSSETSLGLPLELASWGGRGPEEDSSRYANLSDSKDSTAAVTWTARAKVKLAGISRM
uniref:Uncharacterized protein n=1 Tax=Scophthalmus maximus TaxID=52904 RepID=A0A8D3BTW4_SCOMX